MKLKKIKKEIYPSGYIECKEKCPYDRTCANHYTAGDFRSEDGFSPLLELHDREVMCASRYAPGNGAEYHEWPTVTLPGMIGLVKMSDIKEVVHSYEI
jgi:hypothetical protein